MKKTDVYIWYLGVLLLNTLTNPAPSEELTIAEIKRRIILHS